MRYLLFLLFFGCSIAQAAFTDLQFGRYQVADTQWNVNACMYTSTCQIYSKNPGVAYKIPWWNGQLSWATGDYIKFEASGNASYPYTARQYTSTGALKATMGTGKVINAGADYFFFMGSDNNTGQMFSGTTGMNSTAGVTWTGTSNPTTTQMNSLSTNYSATPLSAGQTAAPPAPTYISSITTTQQAHINAAQNLRDTITKNSIYIEQVGSSNQVTVDQQGRYNMIAGTGSTAAPVQGDYNTIAIRQGDPANTFGKNLVQLSVYGSSNTLNLNQGRDTQGNSTGADVGGHMQYVIVSGSSNNVTTRQQNAGQGAHYLETNITGNNNTQNITQLGNAGKQLFTTVSGDGNTFSAYQDGLGAHYLSLNFLGNSNDAQITQTGNTKNAATINLTNSGAPASVTLQQTGGAVYNIDRTCTATCGRVTVSQ